MKRIFWFGVIFLLSVFLSVSAAYSQNNADLPKLSDKVSTETPKTEYPDLSTGGGFFGETGLWKVTSAEPLKSTGIRLNIHGEWFYFKEFLIKNDTTSRQVGDLSVGVVPYDNLEIFALYQTISTYNDKVVPKLQLSQGNISFGLKYSYPVLKYLSTGAMALFTLNTKPGDSTYSLGATGYTLKSITTFDGKGVGVNFLRVHLNLGAYLIGDKPFGENFNIYSHYLLNMNEQKQFLGGLGVDFPLRKERILPFCEVSFGYPDGPGYASAGLKYQPFEKFDLSFDLVTEFGLFRGTPKYAPTTQQYNIVAGISYGVRPTNEVKVVKEKVVEKVCDESCKKDVPEVITGFAKGFVYEEGSETPIGNAIVIMEGTGLTNLATDPVYGDFTTPPIPPNKYNFTILKDGYEPTQVLVEIKKNEKTLVKAFLKKRIVEGSILAKVIDSKGQVVTDAEVVAISGERQVELKKDESNNYSAKLNAGKWYVVAKSENRLSSGKIVDVAADKTQSVEIQLKDKPKETLIVVEKDRIVLKKKIQFAKNSAKIIGNSAIILDMVADAINSNPKIKKVIIEGHTDDTGSREKNIALSQQRADAVKDYLIKAGIPEQILEAKGYGPDKPIASNKTAKGREQNRRVEFVIIE
jgi:outer membrane protein OmpA-like peptidoglycan-associated protein